MAAGQGFAGAGLLRCERWRGGEREWSYALPLDSTRGRVRTESSRNDPALPPTRGFVL
jgi:hypothetical protein